MQMVHHRVVIHKIGNKTLLLIGLGFIRNMFITDTFTYCDFIEWVVSSLKFTKHDLLTDMFISCIPFPSKAIYRVVQLKCYYS